MSTWLLRSLMAWQVSDFTHVSVHKLEEGVNKYFDNFVELKHEFGANNKTQSFVYTNI